MGLWRLGWNQKYNLLKLRSSCLISLLLLYLFLSLSHSLDISNTWNDHMTNHIHTCRSACMHAHTNSMNSLPFHHYHLNSRGTQMLWSTSFGFDFMFHSVSISISLCPDHPIATQIPWSWIFVIVFLRDPSIITTTTCTLSIAMLILLEPPENQ